MKMPIKYYKEINNKVYETFDKVNGIPPDRLLLSIQRSLRDTISPNSTGMLPTKPIPSSFKNFKNTKPLSS